MRAFSLVELSIVLVILGLLTGGILGGQSLIRAAGMRASIAEYQRYVTAARSFQDKYMSLSGDMQNATAFWGIAAGTTGTDDTCRIAVSTDSKTCNGDGDGQILGATAGTNYATYNERHRFWHHLANSGLIEGQYTGTDARNSGQTSSIAAGINTPFSKMGNTIYWYATYQAASAGSATSFAYSAGNILRITGNAYTPAEAWSVDTKLDDGIPGTGKMMSYKGDATSPCTTAAGIAPPGDAGAQYNLSNTDRIVNPWMYF